MRVNMINMVKALILADRSLADSDVDLTWHVWARQLKMLKPSKNIEKLSARELLQVWKSKTIASPYNISRSRRKCQELFPETRGKVYEKRLAPQSEIKRDVKRAANIPNRGTPEGDSYISSKGLKVQKRL